jgi:hypothetical protein
MGIVNKQEVKTKELIPGTHHFINSRVYGDFSCCSKIFTLSIMTTQKTMTIWGKSGIYLNMLQNSFRKIYMPEQKISSDECLMHIKGRFTIKQQGLVWKCPLFERHKHKMSHFLALVKNNNRMEMIFWQKPGSHRSVTKLVFCPELINKGYIVFIGRLSS